MHLGVLQLINRPPRAVQALSFPPPSPALLSPSAPFRHRGNLILLPSTSSHLFQLHTTLFSLSSQPLFSSFFCPHSQRQPPTLTGFSGPQAIAFFAFISQWPAPFAEREAVGHGAWERSPAVPSYRLRGSNSSRRQFLSTGGTF